MGVRVEFVSILVSDTKGGSEERKHTNDGVLARRKAQAGGF